VCALFNAEVEGYVHFLWGEKLTVIYVSRRQEVNMQRDGKCSIKNSSYPFT